jgi:hypothetical protein
MNNQSSTRRGVKIECGGVTCGLSQQNFDPSSITANYAQGQLPGTKQLRLSLYYHHSL